MATPEEDVFEMPLDILQASVGFALDIGGSMAKIVYRSNKEYKNGVPIDENELKTGMGRLHSVQFPRADTDTYVKFLRDNCDIKPGGTLYATGLGGSQYKQKLETLGVKQESLTEFECFARSLNILLERFPKKDWLVELNQAGLELGIKHLRLMKLFQNMTAGLPEMSTEEFDRVYLSQVDAYRQKCKNDREHLAGTPYPYLMVMCGSAFGFIKVEKDGSCEMIEVSDLSGRFFLGMATILSGGEKDYMKYIEMAKTHDGSSVDIWGKHFKSEGQADDMYSKIESDVRVFPFGKCHDIKPDEMKRGDMVNSILQTICENLAMATCNVAGRHGLKDAYFCGGFVGQEIARRYITKGICWRNLSVPIEQRMHIEFLSNSGHLGSIGAFIRPMANVNI